MRAVAATQRALGRVWSATLPWLIGGLYAVTSLDFEEPVALVPAAVLVFALRRRGERPELAVALAVPAELLYAALVPDLVIPVGALVALWSLTVVRPPRQSVVGLVGTLAAASFNVFRQPGEETVFVYALAVTVWAVAEAARNRIASAHEAIRRATTEEQARIARELHDVIAHTVSGMVVQAAAAEDVFDAHPDQARAALRSIEASGRQALQELRLLLSGLRPDAAAPSEPLAGLGQLEELATPLRAAGVTVDVRTVGDAAPLPAGIDLAAYRIVQEALTNALRHARARRVEVTLRHHSEHLEVEIVDDGDGESPRGPSGTGLGLVGMRERASVLGGTLDAGPTAHGGFRVLAQLPREGRR